MATNNPRGLVPFKHLSGNPIIGTRRYAVSSDNPKSIFRGDPVELGDDGHVRVIDTSGVSALERGILGVVVGIEDSNGRPLTHDKPTGGGFLDASTAGFVHVADDPHTTYLISSDATADQTMVGKFCRVTAGSANSAAGISGFHLRLADATASSVGHRFRIIGVGPNERAIGNDRVAGAEFAANQDMEILISDHDWKRANVRVGVTN
jgi:hypothetical protein|tara:strand:- start:1 stop:621 length:621 start_codon:yes stop_codon:yes gene_type:complete